MSIELKEMTINNWLVYQGIVRLAFSKPEPGKNLWVVHGLNGSGKTSLLRAIQWVFRNGRSADRYFDAPLLHNREAIRAGNSSLEVTVRFSHRGRECLLKRSQSAQIREGTATGIKSTELTLVIDGRDESNSVDDKLAKILPWECQQFAFFDGLEIQSYAQKQHSQETRGAIELILGIPEVRNLRDDLHKLSKDIERERDEALSDKGAYQRVRVEKDKLDTDRQAWEERISLQKEKLNSLELIVRDLERQAAELGHKEERIKELKTKGRMLEDLNGSIRSLELNQQALTSRAALFLLRDLIARRVKSLEDTRIITVTHDQKRGQQAMKIAILEEVLEKGRCICNRGLDGVADFLEAELAKEKKLSAASQSPVHPYSSSSAELITRLQALLLRLKDELVNPEGLHLLRLEKEHLREEVEQDIVKLREQLKEHADTDIQSVYQALEANKGDQDDGKIELARFEQELSKANDEIVQKDKELNQHLAGMQGYEELEKKIDYLQRLRSAVDELVDRFIKDRHATIQATLNRVFMNITNKPKEYDRVALLDDYALRIITKAENQIEPDKLSAGEKEVLAFSFIAGLNLASENPAPLVMDTPFGHLDVQHRDGLLQALPSLPNQVILLATDRDFPKDERKRMERNIAGEFELYRIQNEERTTIREL